MTDRTTANHSFEQHEPQLPPPRVLIESPSWARLNNYYLGGKKNWWMIDRDFANGVLDKFPMERANALRHRLFLHRAVRYMADTGIRQFVDIGSGVPDNLAVHVVADTWSKERGRALDTEVCYIEHDPIAVGHGEINLAEADIRRHIMVETDLRTPYTLWENLLDRALIDPAQPLGVLAVATMQLEQLDITGREVGPESLAQLRQLLPAGSYLAISHVTHEGREANNSEANAILADVQRMYSQAGVGNFVWRSRAEIEALLGNYEPIEPGWVPAEEWGEEYTGANAPTVRPPKLSHPLIWAAVGKKTS